MRFLTTTRFSLLELASVVALLMVLAALAIPSWYRTQLRTKRAEVPVVLEGLREHQVAYHAANDGFALQSTDPHPATPPGKTTRPWFDGSVPDSFEALDFEPDGDVYGQYRMRDTFVMGEWMLQIIGVCDVDGHGPQFYERWQLPMDAVTAGWEQQTFCPPGLECF